MSTDHIRAEVLDRFHAAPEELSSTEIAAIESHLEVCALCREHSLRLKEFYAGIRDGLNSPPSERDRALASKAIARKRLALPFRALERGSAQQEMLEAYSEIVESRGGPLVHRFTRYIRFHPIQFAGATALVAAALVYFLMGVH